MAPEIRLAVLRTAVETKAVPGGCYGLLAYLYIVAPEVVKSEELAAILEVSDKTLRQQLRVLEIAGFIALKRGRYGMTLGLLLPKGVQTVKLNQNDTSFSKTPDVHEIGKIDGSGSSRSVKSTDLGTQIGKIDGSEKVQIGKIDRPEIPDQSRLPTSQGDFLRGMLEALENGSKPDKTNPICPDNNETESS